MRRLFPTAELTPLRSRRFELTPIPGRFGPVLLEGFAVRLVDTRVRAFVNLCPHRGQPVDVGDGRLFTGSGTIECQAHGAVFDPANGACVGGPCEGRGLTPLAIEERDGAVWLEESVRAGDE